MSPMNTMHVGSPFHNSNNDNSTRFSMKTVHNLDATSSSQTKLLQQKMKFSKNPKNDFDRVKQSVLDNRMKDTCPSLHTCVGIPEKVLNLRPVDKDKDIKHKSKDIKYRSNTELERCYNNSPMNQYLQITDGRRDQMPSPDLTK